MCGVVAADLEFSDRGEGEPNATPPPTHVRFGLVAETVQLDCLYENLEDEADNGLTEAWRCAQSGPCSRSAWMRMSTTVPLSRSGM